MSFSFYLTQSIERPKRSEALFAPASSERFIHTFWFCVGSLVFLNPLIVRLPWGVTESWSFWLDEAAGSCLIQPPLVARGLLTLETRSAMVLHLRVLKILNNWDITSSVGNSTALSYQWKVFPGVQPEPVKTMFVNVVVLHYLASKSFGLVVFNLPNLH